MRRSLMVGGRRRVCLGVRGLMGQGWVVRVVGIKFF